MFGSDMLEVGIGLTLLFLSMSLICTAAREAIEGVLKSRAKDLEQGIREMLDDPSGSGLTKQLFDHPLLFSLFSGRYDPNKLSKHRLRSSARMGLRAGRSLPSYIPASQFAHALLDVVVRGPVKPMARADAVRAVISIDALRDGAAALPHLNVQRAVLSAIDMAQGDLDKARANIENWYNGTMDRVSGWYKRRTQTILFSIGLATAAALNVDAITVAKRLNDDKALRQAAAAQASAIVSGRSAAEPTGAARGSDTAPESQPPTGSGASEDARATGRSAGTGGSGASRGAATRDSGVPHPGTAASQGATARQSTPSTSTAGGLGRRVAVAQGGAASAPADAASSGIAGARPRAGLAAPAPGHDVPAQPLGERRMPGHNDGVAKLADLQKQTYTQLRANLEEVGFPIGWYSTGNPLDWSGFRLVPAPQACLRSAASADGNPRNGDHPIGRAGADRNTPSSPPPQCNRYVDPGFSGWMGIVLGWLVTALAIMLGAPFWFDVLNKFVVIRSTVKPHEKSLEEGSEDRRPIAGRRGT